MFSTLSGYASQADSMFGTTRPQVGPTAEEMEAAAQRIQFKKHVAPTAHHTRIFDMHVRKDAAAYEKLMMTLMLGVQANTHFIWKHDLNLISTPQGQRWKYYVEWCEFKLTVEKVAPIASAREE